MPEYDSRTPWSRAFSRLPIQQIHADTPHSFHHADEAEQGNSAQAAHRRQSLKNAGWLTDCFQDSLPRPFRLTGRGEKQFSRRSSFSESGTGKFLFWKKAFRRTKKYYSFAIPFLHAFTIQHGKTQHFCMLKQYQRRTILQYNVIPGAHISLRKASFLEKFLLFSIRYIVSICTGSFWIKNSKFNSVKAIFYILLQNSIYIYYFYFNIFIMYKKQLLL